MELVATRLCALYNESFGGKQKGRYRIASKLVAQLAGRRRLYEDDIRDLSRHMFENGYVFVDMGAFFVILSVNTFVNYRRANADIFEIHQ